MNNGLGRLTDLEIVLHCDPFLCHLCKSEETFLHRVRVQEWPEGPYPLEDDERYVIRRRLVCDRCISEFVYVMNTVCAFATVAGKTWCLRERPGNHGTIYTQQRWHAYVDRVRSQRLI